MENHDASKVTYVFAGLAVGALVAILFAPKSGEATREFLAQKVGGSKEYAQHKVRELRKGAEGFVERGKRAALRQNQSISAAFEAGQQAYRREVAKARHA